jgi:DNA-binding response OmpR family regulator
MKNILIIEDDPRIAAALEIRFRTGGYQTFTAGNVTVGMDQAVRRRPDLMLLDISLPGGDGLALAKRFRSLPETRQIPIIFVTASKDPGLRVKAMNLHAAGLFEKPYDPEELLAVAGHAMGDTGMFRRQRPVHGGAATSPTVASVAKKILIIEDDRNIATALSVRLGSVGYEVTTASDALTGLTTAIKLRPDLVLLDVSMPAVNGFGVAERMRTLSPAPTPVIFLTASKEPGLRQRARDFGAAAFFEKPYEAEDLLAAIRQTLA